MHSITVAGPAAFALEYSAAIARDGAKSFDQLSRGRKDAFRRVGITSADWDIEPHAAAYGVVSYQTAYMKANYGVQLMRVQVGPWLPTV